MLSTAAWILRYCLRSPVVSSPLVLQLPCHVFSFVCPVPTKSGNHHLLGPHRENVLTEGTDNHLTLFSRFCQERQIRVFASNPQEHTPIHHFAPIRHQIPTSLFFPGLPTTPSPYPLVSIISFPVTAFQDHLNFTPKFHFSVYTHTQRHPS